MRATITRTITESKIYGFAVTANEGEPSIKQLDPISVYGKVEKDEAKKELEKAYPDYNTIGISKIETSENCYEIAVTDFIKNAKIIEKVGK